MKKFQGRIFSIEQRRQRLPGNKKVVIDAIHHPGAALIVPFLRRDVVVMLRQYRPVIKKYLFELPAGTLEKGENPIQCARREIVEETGFYAKRLHRLGKIFPVPGYSTEVIHIYEARDLVEAEENLDADEVIRHYFFSAKQIKNLFLSGKIIDAKTICALKLSGIL